MTLDEIPANLPNHLRGCCVPEEHVKAVAKEPTETFALQEMRTWFDTQEKTLALVGRNGCGKTFAAVWALSRSMVKFDVFRWEKGDLPPDYRFKSGFYVHAADLQTRTTGHGGAVYHDDEKPILRRAKSCSLLVLDECGREDGDASRALGPILSARMESEGKRTILISNMLEDQFRERYKGRILSRLTGSGRIVACQGRDLRQHLSLEVRP